MSRKSCSEIIYNIFEGTKYTKTKVTFSFVTALLTIMSLVTPPCPPIALPSSPSSLLSSFHVTLGTEISDDLLKSCAQLFSNNYGKWGEKAITISPYTKTG